MRITLITLALWFIPQVGNSSMEHGLNIRRHISLLLIPMKNIVLVRVRMKV
jgi:hypothetical protein